MKKAKLYIKLISLALLILTAVCTYLVTHTVIYVSPNGNDANQGTKEKPLQSITLAYNMIRFWGTVFLLPGIYREEILLAPSNSIRGPITLQGGTGDRSAIVMGSEPSSLVSWSVCNPITCPGIRSDIRNHVYIGTLPWKKRPTTIIETTKDGIERQLYLARTPNYQVTDPNKYHQYWWSADTTNTSPDYLVDTKNDPGLQTGNLTTTPLLTGGTAVIMDGSVHDRCGMNLFTRQIVAHDQSLGKVSFDGPIGATPFGYQENGNGPYTKYYVENILDLLDSPGEWFYDDHSGNLYLWPLEEGSPDRLALEIGVRDTGIRINASHVRIDDITVKNINDQKNDDNYNSGAVVIRGNNEHINGILLNHLTIQHVGNGIMAAPQGMSSIHSVTVQNSDISDTTKSPIFFYGGFPPQGNLDTVSIINTTIHNAGFPYTSNAITIGRASNITIKNNHIYDDAGYGIMIIGYGKLSKTIQNIRVANNEIDHICQNASGCSAIKFFGGAFTHTIAFNNIVRDNLGWSYCQTMANDNQGYVSGISLSNASGITVRNNVAVNNANGYSVYPRQVAATHNTFLYNQVVHSKIGIDLQNAEGYVDNDPRVYASRNDYTTIKGNIFSNNRIAISLDPAHPDTIQLDDNVYINNTIATMYFRKLRLPRLSDIQKHFRYWDIHSKEIL